MRTSPRGRAALTVVVVALALVALAAFVFLPPPNEKSDLQADLAVAAAEVGDGGRIRLADVADFDWDRAYVFDAYTPADVVAGELGGWVPMSRLDGWMWGDLFLPNDGFALVVFVRGDHEVTGYRVVSPYEDDGVYMNTGGLAVMPRDSAVFSVDGDAESGWGLTPSGE